MKTTFNIIMVLIGLGIIYSMWSYSKAVEDFGEKYEIVCHEGLDYQIVCQQVLVDEMNHEGSL